MKIVIAGIGSVAALFGAVGLQANADVSWTYNGSVGTTAIDKGEEKAETHTIHQLELALPAGDGEVTIGAGLFQPLGSRRELADQETEYWISYGHETQLGEVAFTAAHIEIEGGSNGSEFEVAGEYVAPLPLRPTLELNYNVTNKELLSQLAIGPEFEARDWTVGLQAVGGYLSVEDDDDRHFWGAVAFAMYDLGAGAEIGPSVQYFDSNQEGFIAAVRDGGATSFESSGFSFQLALTIRH